ncbi:MAG: S41 family peptidase [Trueperaceae bacterium]
MHRDDAIADLMFLERALEERFAYLTANAVDHSALFMELRERLPPDVQPDWLGLELQKLLANFIDGHAATNVPPSPTGYLPFLTGFVGDQLVAYEADRGQLVDGGRPFLVSIDDVPVSEWLAVAASYVARGSPQLVSRGSQRWLRAVQMLRGEMGLPSSDDVDIVLAGTNILSPRKYTLRLTDRPPQFGVWPRTESRLLEENVGYIRLPHMNADAVDAVRDGLERFGSTDGLIIDVRGNSGGSRDALLALMPALMSPEEPPRVVNVAAYRNWSGFPQDHLANRHLYPLDSKRWSPAERSAIESFMEDFTPAWRPPVDDFSDWHAMVVSPAKIGEPTYLSRPVVVLMDAACFSATDVFLSALGALPNVLLVGEASGGGSARAQVVELPNSGVKARFASMASFQATGELFDGTGVQPHVRVKVEPDYFVSDGTDHVLQAAKDELLHRLGEVGSRHQ